MQYRNTHQKCKIYNTIDKNGHLTVEELINILKDEKDDMSLSTIYRNLTILTEEKKIKKIYSNYKTMYETIKEDHYHFECLKCHNVIDIDKNKITIKINQSDIDVIKNDLFLYGICNKCKNKINEEK